MTCVMMYMRTSWLSMSRLGTANEKIGSSLAAASMKATGAEQLAGSKWMGASRMWIVVVYGLLPVGQVYSES
jgi:hypothetical protein